MARVHQRASALSLRHERGAHIFISIASGWPMPPAAPSTATVHFRRTAPVGCMRSALEPSACVRPVPLGQGWARRVPTDQATSTRRQESRAYSCDRELCTRSAEPLNPLAWACLD